MLRNGWALAGFLIVGVIAVMFALGVDPKGVLNTRAGVAEFKDLFINLKEMGRQMSLWFQNLFG